MDEIKIGDVVKANGLDQAMTVDDIRDNMNGITLCKCVWFDQENHLQRGSFNVVILTKGR